MFTDLEMAKEKYKILLRNILNINKKLISNINFINNNTNDTNLKFSVYLQEILSCEDLDELNWKNKKALILDEDRNEKK